MFITKDNKRRNIKMQINMKTYSLLKYIENKGDTYILEASRHADVTYSAAHDIIHNLESKGILIIDKKGRGKRNNIKLTQKGKELLRSLDNIFNE